MSIDLRDLFLSKLPEDGSAIGNMSFREVLRDIVPDMTDAQYDEIRDGLLDEGLVVKGKGRGGSVALAVASDDDEEDDDFQLTAPEGPDDSAPKPMRSAAPRKKAVARTDEPTQVLSYRHTDTRVNNPEVGMVHPENDPDQPKTKWAYDPHLDPELMFDHTRARFEKIVDDALASGDVQTMKEALEELKRLQQPYLAWSGKAERTSFEVDTVSLHVHERVDPATILANVAKRLKSKDAAQDWRQASFFEADFERMPLRKAVEFYKHPMGWMNRLVAGDSLLVMNSLLQKEAMAGKVQMVFFDPPYGIKYGSNFQPFVSKRDVKDGADDDLTQEPEMIKAFRDTWELGIHSYLTYLRDRLMLAKELMHESGSIFVQISDENLHHVTELMSEIFGSSNFISLITFSKTSSATSGTLASVSDYLIWFSKNRLQLKYRQLYSLKELGGQGASGYNSYENEFGQIYSGHPTKETEKSLTTGDMTSARPAGEGDLQSFIHMGMDANPGKGTFKSDELGLTRLAKSRRLLNIGKSIRYKRYFEDFPVFPINSSWTDTGIAGFSADKKYVVETSVKVVERCLMMTTDPGDLIFDPTCGSGTTAFAAEKWGRRWVTCDTSRVALTLAKQRLMTSSFDYFQLRHPHEGLRGGFIFQTVPHIMLKSIANNPDIDVIYEEKHPAITAALNELNATIGNANPFVPSQGYRKGVKVAFKKGDVLEEWEVPFEFPDNWPDAAKAPFDAFHKARQSMQAEMDRSIAAHADNEILYDKPIPDPNRLRITGPFTVEAVPAPTVLTLEQAEASSATEADTSIARSGETSKQGRWRDELLKAGIRAKGGQMMKFSDLEPIPGLKHLHASGTVSDSGERVVVSFGPEHAALEQKQVERALEEAGTLMPRPKFVVFCAFTFDPEAAKDIDEMTWPGVTLLKAQMNTDLLTNDLKKNKASNQSFWLMGQPDVELHKRGDKYIVEVNGFDYFDPRTGQLVSGGKSKIAMWSLDTDYDGRSVMPHQVFFPMAGAKDGWNRLKKTIRAELNEDALEMFHGTESLAFEAGDHRRVAVKIVDDRGIESLKIIKLD